MGISRPWPCRHSTSRNNIIRSISQQCQAGPIPQGASRASAGPGLAGITTQHNSIMSISRQCPTQSKPTARASWTSAGLGLAGITTRNNIIIELATSARQEPHSIMSISPWRKEADQEREPHGHQLALALQAFYQPKQHHQEHQPPMSGRASPPGASRASAGPGLAGIMTQRNSIMSISRQCPTQSKPTARASWTSAGPGLAGITTRNNIIIRISHQCPTGAAQHHEHQS